MKDIMKKRASAKKKFEYIKSELKKGKTKVQIIKEVQNEYGVTESYAKTLVYMKDHSEIGERDRRNREKNKEKNKSLSREDLEKRYESEHGNRKKRCPKGSKYGCGEVKDIREFRLCRYKPDGFWSLCRICGRSYAGERRIELRKKGFLKFGCRCVYCGETTYEWLALDHVDDDPEKCPGGHRVSTDEILARLKREGWLKEEMKRYQILCHNCNVAKRDYGVVAAKKLGRKKNKKSC